MPWHRNNQHQSLRSVFNCASVCVCLGVQKKIQACDLHPYCLPTHRGEGQLGFVSAKQFYFLFFIIGKCQTSASVSHDKLDLNSFYTASLLSNQWSFPSIFNPTRSVHQIWEHEIMLIYLTIQAQLPGFLVRSWVWSSTVEVECRMFSSGLCGFPPGSPSWWIGCSTLPLGVNVCLHGAVLHWRSVEGVFLPHISCSCNPLWPWRG